MRKHLLLLFCLASLMVNAQINLVTNGDFENQFVEWNNLIGEDAEGTFTLEGTDVHEGNASMRANITTAGENPWDVQSIHSGLTLSTEEEYTLTFYAKAETSADVKIILQNAEYAEKIFTIGTTWSQYIWTFTPAEETPQLKIHYPNAGNFLFDAFVINGELPTIDPITIEVDAFTQHQEMIGFGGAITWYCDRVTSSPNNTEMYELFFEDLGMDILRLKNWYYPQGYPTTKSPATMEVDWFKPHFDATATLFNEAKSYNPEMEVLLSSWGPPSALKSNGALEEGTLKKENGDFVYDEYAQYWEDVLDNTTFNPDYISIQNEPGYENEDWTTTAWRPNETADYPGYETAFDMVYDKIKGRSYVPAMIGPECENIGQAVYDNSINTYEAYASVVQDKPYLAAYGYHLYNFYSPGAINNSLLNMVGDDFNNKPNFMTEFSSDNYSWVQTAELIQKTLIEANTSAYIFWELMWDENSTKAMVAVDGDGNFTVQPHYHALKHFAKYVDKGYKRVDVMGNSGTSLTTAFLNKAGDEVTLVMTNTAASEQVVTVGFGNINGSTKETYQSVDGSYFQAVDGLNPTESITLPANSITTMVVTLSEVVTSDSDFNFNTLDETEKSGLYPNPVETVLYLNKGTENTAWEIRNQTGELIKSGVGNTINVKELNSGMYFLKSDLGINKFIKD